MGTHTESDGQMKKHWAVEVKVDGESILVIESNCYGGKADLSAEELKAIRKAAKHLLAFAGDGGGSTWIKYH